MARPGLVDDERLRVGNASRGGLVCQELLVLEGRWARFRQAWGHRWRDQQALLLSPADAVHSFGARSMNGRRAGLRVHYLDAEWQVLASEILPKRRSTPCPEGCAAALLLSPEAPALLAGDRLELIRPQPRFADRLDAE
jgi:hypothetical protein